MATIVIPGGGSAASSTLTASCTAADDLGDCVKISGDAVDGVYQVASVDITAADPNPACGIIISKSSPTDCVVQVSGIMSGIYTGLTSGRLYFVDVNSRLDTDPPVPPGAGDTRYVQSMGQAVSDDVIVLAPALPIKRVG